MKMGHIISKLRYESGYSQVELAEKIGITKGAVGMYETDKRKPDYDTLIKLADLFNVSTDYLLSHTVDSISKTSNHSVNVSLDSSRYSKQGLYILELYESMNEESQAIRKSQGTYKRTTIRRKKWEQRHTKSKLIQFPQN